MEPYQGMNLTERLKSKARSIYRFFLPLDVGAEEGLQ